MMAATHLPTTHTPHTIQTITLGREPTYFLDKRKKMATKEKREITLAWFMENRKESDRKMCACAGLSTLADNGEIKRRRRE